MIETKHAAVLAWLKTYPGFGGYLKLNAVEYQQGETSLITEFNDAVVQRFVSGAADKQYTFTVSMVLTWSSGFDSINETALKAGSAFLDWIDQQFKRQNVPDFGTSATITNIEALQNMPSLALVDQDARLAKYTFSARISYREEPLCN